MVSQSTCALTSPPSSPSSLMELRRPIFVSFSAIFFPFRLDRERMF
nr:MAG TPA: hypothetical protein [Caudoviricetes sp.]